MKKVEAIIAPSELDAVRDSLVAHGVEGVSISPAASYPDEPYRMGYYRGTPYTVDLHPKVKIEVVVCDEEAMPTAYAIVDAAGACHLGDDTLMIMPIEDAVRIRTGERGRAAIHDHVELPAEPRWVALG